MRGSLSSSLLVVALLVLTSLMAETGYGYVNKRGVRLRRYQLVRWDAFRNGKVRYMTYRHRKPARRPFGYVVDGCPFLNGVPKCPTNYIAKRNWTMTYTNINHTMTRSIQKVPDIDLRIIQRPTASSFYAIVNRTTVQVELKLDTWGEIAYMFYRVRTGGPTAPTVPKHFYDAISHSSSVYKVSKNPKTRLDAAVWACAPTKFIDNKVRQAPLNTYRAFKTQVSNCSTFLTFKDLIPGEKYAFFAVANRTRYESFGTVVEHVDVSAVRSAGELTMRDRIRPSWVSLERAPSLNNENQLTVQVMFNEPVTVQCYAAFPHVYTGVPYPLLPDLQPVRVGTTQTVAPHPSTVTTVDQVRVVGLGTTTLTRDETAATSLYCCTNKGTVNIPLQGTEAQAAAKQGVLFDIFCSGTDAAGLISAVRSIQDLTKDVTPPEFTKPPTVNIFPIYKSGANFVADGAKIALNFTMNEPGKVWYFVAPSDQFAAPTASYVGTVVDQGTGGIRAGFITVRRTPDGWQGTERSEALDRSATTRRCCYESRTLFLDVLPALKYRVVLVGYDLGIDYPAFTGLFKRSVLQENIQTLPTGTPTAPTTIGTVGAITGGNSQAAHFIFWSAQQNSGVPKLQRFGPCVAGDTYCNTFTAEYSRQTTINLPVDRTSFQLEYKLDRPGYLTYFCAKYEAGQVNNLLHPHWPFIRRQLRRGLNITSRTNSTRRVSQVFTGKLLYDTVSAGKNHFATKNIKGLLPGLTYFCLAEIADLTETKKVDVFSGLVTGHLTATGLEVGSASAASGNARPYFLFKTKLDNALLRQRLDFNATRRYNDVDLRFWASKRSRFYYVVAPVRPTVSVDYARNAYSTKDKNQLPKVGGISHQDLVSTAMLPNRDLFNTATGRSVGALSDTTKYDTTGNKGFIGMLHADDRNFAGMVPQNTAGVVDCEEVFVSEVLQVICFPTVLNNGRTVTTMTWESQMNASPQPKQNTVRVSGLEQAMAYKVYYFVQDLDDHTFTPLHHSLYNNTRFVRAPQITPRQYGKTAYLQNFDGLAVKSIWTTRAIINVTLNRPGRVYWAVVRHDAIPFTAPGEIMRAAAVAAKAYVPPITGTAAAVDKAETLLDGYQKHDGNRFVFDAGIVDYYFPNGATSPTLYPSAASYTADGHMEIVRRHNTPAQQTIRGLRHGQTYTLYAVPVDFDPALNLIGAIVYQNFTTRAGKPCTLSTAYKYKDGSVYTTSVQDMPEDKFAQGLVVEYSLSRATGYPDPGDACYWSKTLRNANFDVKAALRQRLHIQYSQRAVPSPYGLHYHFNTMLNGLTVTYLNSTATSTDYFDVMRIEFPAVNTGLRPFDVYRDESFCPVFLPGDLMISNELPPETPATACPIAKAIAGAATAQLTIASVAKSNLNIEEADIHAGNAVIRVTLTRETFKLGTNSTFRSIFTKRGSFAEYLIATGPSAGSWNSMRSEIVPYATITNNTLTFTLRKQVNFYTQNDIAVRINIVGLMTRSTIAIPEGSQPVFNVIAPIRTVSVTQLDKNGLDALSVTNRAGINDQLFVSTIRDIELRQGLTGGNKIVLRWRIATTPDGRDGFKDSAPADLLRTITFPAVSTTNLNTHGLNMYRDTVFKADQCVMQAGTLRSVYVDCAMTPAVDYTIAQNEVITISPPSTTLALKSGLAFTITGGTASFTIVKTAGSVTVSPSTLTEDQVRAGVTITYTIVGDQYETNPLPFLTFTATRTSSNVATDVGTEPFGFRALNEYYRAAYPAAVCLEPVCQFPSCNCGAGETCPSQCTLSGSVCTNPACTVAAFSGVGGMFRTQAIDANNRILDAPLSRKLVLNLYNPEYDISNDEVIKIAIADNAIRSNGFPLDVSGASIRINATQGTLTMSFKSPRNVADGQLSEAEVREGGTIIDLTFSTGETFKSTTDGLQCLFDAWQPLQQTVDQTAAFTQKRTELLNPKTAIKVINQGHVVRFTFQPSPNYNTKGTDVVKFDVFTYVARCVSSGISPRFIQGNSRSSVLPQFQVNDGNPMIQWNSPSEYAVGTYTAVVTENDVRAGLNLQIRLIGDTWVPQSPPTWLSSTIFKTASVPSLPAVNAPIFSAVMSSANSIDKTNSKRDADTSLYTIVTAAQPNYDITGTETVLVSIPANTAGAASSSIVGNFEPSFGTASGLIIKIVAFKISFSLSEYAAAVGRNFDVTANVQLSGWSAAASPDPSASRIDVPLTTVPQAELINGVRNAQNVLIRDTVVRLSGTLNATGVSGVVTYKAQFINAASCGNPCVTLGISIPSLKETLFDVNQASTLKGGVFPTILDNWQNTIPTPISSITTNTPTPLLLQINNGGITPVSNQYKIRVSILVGSTTAFTRDVFINSTTTNVGLVNATLSGVSTPQDGVLEIALLNADNTPVFVNNAQVKFTYTLKVVPLGGATFTLYDTPLPNDFFSVQFQNSADKVGTEALLIDSVSTCGAPNAIVYDTKRLLANQTVRFYINTSVATYTFPLTVKICVNGTSVGGTFKVNAAPVASYTLLTATVRVNEEATIRILPGTSQSSGMSFFLSSTTTCDVSRAVPFAGSSPPLISTRADGQFTFVIDETFTASSAYVCYKSSTDVTYKLIAAPLTVQAPPADIFDISPRSQLEQFKDVYIRVQTNRAVEAYRQIAMVKLASGFTCESLGTSPIPAANLVNVAGQNPSYRLRAEVSTFLSLFLSFLNIPTIAVVQFTPQEFTQAAGFCSRSTPSSPWRTLRMSDTTTTIKISSAPSYQLVATSYATLLTAQTFSIQLTASTTAAAYLTAEGHCQKPPTTTSSTTATSGLFSGVSSTGTSGLLLSSEGVLTLVVPADRMLKKTSRSTLLCFDKTGSGQFESIRRENGGYVFDVRAGQPHHLVISYNEFTDATCPIMAVRERNFRLPALTITVQDSNNITVDTAANTITLSVRCFTSTGATSNTCNLRGQTSLNIIENNRGTVVANNLFIQNVQFGGRFIIVASYPGVTADTLLRDITCKGNLQFNVIGALSFGGTVFSGFNVPDPKSGFDGATLTISIAEDTFASALCTSDVLKTTFLNGIRRSDAKNATEVLLFTLASFQSCSSTQVRLAVNVTYKPVGIESWFITLPRSVTERAIADPTFTSNANVFTLQARPTVTFTSTSSSVSENDLTYLSGFNITMSVSAPYQLVDIASFAQIRGTIRSAVDSQPANSTNTQSSFTQVRTEMVPLDGIIRVNDQTVMVQVRSNPNYHINDADILTFSLPAGTIAGYGRQEVAGNVTVTASPDVAAFNFTVNQTQFFPGDSFQVTVATVDASGALVPMYGLVPVTASSALQGAAINIAGGRGSGTFRVTQVGNATVVLRLAGTQVPTRSFTINVTLNLANVQSSTLIAPPSIIAPNMPFDLAISIMDPFGNTVPNGMQFFLNASSGSFVTSSAMRRLMQTSTAGNVSARAVDGVVQFRQVKMQADSSVSLTVTSNALVYARFPLQFTKTVFAFVGAYPVQGAVLGSGMPAYITVIASNETGPMVGRRIVLTPLQTAGTVRGASAITDATGIARFDLTFPIPGDYTFIAALDVLTSQSPVFTVGSGPAVALTVSSSPTPTTSTVVSPKDSFIIGVTAQDSTGAVATSATNAITYSFTGPARGILLSQPAFTNMVKGTANLEFSVSQNGNYTFVLCIAGTSNCTTTVVYANGPAADVILESESTFNDCTLVVVTARFNASTIDYPNMFVTWSFQDAAGNSYPLPGQWNIGDAINYNSANVLGAQLANLGDSAAKAADLSTGVARLQFRPGQVGLTETFRIQFGLSFAPGSAFSYRTIITVTKDANAKTPTNVRAVSPPAVTLNASLPGVTIVDSTVYSIFIGKFDYTGCSIPTAYWECVQYADFGAAATSCTWTDPTTGTSSPYLAAEHTGGELRLAPRSLPAPPAYRAYTFVVNGIRSAPIEVQSQNLPFRVTLDRGPFYGTSNDQLYTIYCIRPPAEVAASGVLSYDPLAADTSCSDCIVTWSLGGATSTGNIREFITPLGTQLAAQTASLRQPLYGIRVATTQPGTLPLKCEITKPNQASRTASATIDVRFVAQAVPNFILQQYRSAGQSGPHNRDTEEGLRIVAVLGSATDQFFTIPVGYSSLTYTVQAINAQNVATATTFTQSGARVSSIAIAAGAVVGPVTLSTADIPISATKINVTATLSAQTDGFIPLTTYIVVEIAQAPTFVATSVIGALYTDSSSSTKLTLTQTGTVQVAQANEGSFAFSIPKASFTSNYTADVLAFRIRAVELTMVGNAFQAGSVSSLGPVGSANKDGDYIIPDDEIASITVANPALANNNFKFEICARNKYLAEQCVRFDLQIQQRTLDFPSLEQTIESTVGPIGAVGALVPMVQFFTLTNLLGSFNTQCLNQRTLTIRQRCLKAARQHVFSMSQLAFTLVGSLNADFRTRFSNFGFSLLRMARGGSFFITSDSSARLRNAINLFVNFGIAQRLYLGDLTYRYLLGAQSWLISAGSPVTPDLSTITGLLGFSTHRQLLAVATDVSSAIADLDRLQDSFSLNLGVGETRSQTTSDGVFLQTQRSAIASIPSTYLIGPTNEQWTVTSQSNFALSYANGNAASTFIVDYRSRIFPKGVNPRAGAGTIKPNSKVISLELKAVSGGTLGSGTNTIEITLPTSVTSVDGVPVPEFVGATTTIQPECYRWSSTIGNWVSARSPSSPVKCIGDINAGKQDYTLVVPPPFVSSTISCPTSVLPDELFNCTITPKKGNVVNAAPNSTFEIAASGFTVVSGPTGTSTAAPFVITLRAGSTSNPTASITVTTQTAYIVNQPLTVAIGNTPISGSILTCERLIIQSGCPNATVLQTLASQQCESIPAMTLNCSVSVKDATGNTAFVCMPGTECRGNTLGSIVPQVRIAATGEVINNNVVSVYKPVGSTPSSTTTVLSNFQAGSAANANNAVSAFSFLVNAPYGTNGLDVRVSVRGTQDFIKTKFNGDGWPLSIRANAPDTTSPINCERLSSSPRITNGRIIFMPITVGAKSTGAYQSAPNIPGNSQECLSNSCASIVRCYITPRSTSNATLKGFAYDFDPSVTAVATGSSVDVTVGPVTGSTGSATCDCSGFTPEQIVQCTCTTVDRYYFDITAKQVAVKDTNLHRLRVNANGVEVAAFTHTFNVNYAEVQSNFQVEVGCKPSQGADSANTAVSARPVICKGIVKDSTGLLQPVPTSCMGITSYITNARQHFSNFVAIKTIDGIGFEYQATPSEVGLCDGNNGNTCSYTIQLSKPTSGVDYCNATTINSGQFSVTVQHGIPTTTTSLSCSSGSGLVAGNVRTDEVVSCSITPADQFGSITLDRGSITATPSTGSVNNNDKVAVSNGRQITFAFRAPSTVPTTGTYGATTLTISYGNAVLTTTILYVVSYPTQQSTVACTPDSVATLQKVTCTIVPRNSNGNTTADPNDFFIVPVDSAVGSYSLISAVAAGSTYLNRANSELTFTFTAGKTLGTDRTISVQSRYIATAPTTRQSNDTLVAGSSYSLSGSPKAITVVYGSATTASVLSCDTLTGITVLPSKATTCTVVVRNALGATTVSPSSPPFSVSVSTGASNSALTSADGGETFTFTATPGDALVLGQYMNITTTLSSAHITGSPINARVAYKPTTNSTITCAGTTVKGLSTITCTITPKDSNNVATKGSVSDFTVSPSIGTVSQFTAGANDNSVTFTFAAPAVMQNTNVDLRLSVGGVATTPVSLTVVPGVPTAASTFACVSRFGNTTVEIGRTLTCTITPRDANGAISAAAGVFTVAAPAQGSVSVPTSTDNGATYIFTYLANVTAAPVEAQIVVSVSGGASLAPVSAKVVYGTPTSAVIACNTTAPQGNGVVSCTVTFRDAVGATTIIDADAAFAVNNGATRSQPVTTDLGASYTFLVTVPAATGSVEVSVTYRGSKIGSIALNVNGTPAPTLPSCSVAVSVFTASPLSASSAVVVQAKTAVTGATFVWAVTGHPTLQQSSTTSEYLTLPATTTAATISVTVTVVSTTNRNCSGQVSFTTISAPVGGSLSISKSSVVTGGNDSVVLTCSGWNANNNGIRRYTFYRRSVVLAQTPTEAYTYKPAYSPNDDTVELACTAENSFGMESTKSAQVILQERKTQIATGAEENYISNVFSSLPVVSSGTTTDSAAYADAISAYSNAVKALDSLSALTAQSKAQRAADMASKLKDAAAVGTLSVAQKDQFTQMSVTVVKNADKTSATAFNNMFEVMKKATAVPISQTAAAAAKDYAQQLFSMFASTNAHNFKSLQSTTSVQDTTTSQALAVIARSAQAVLFSGSAVPGTTYAQTSATFKVYSLLETSTANANANLQTNDSSVVVPTLSNIGGTFGVVRITFTTNPRAYAGSIDSQVVAFATFNSTDFIAGDIALAFTGKANGAVVTWDKDANGAKVSGWTACSGSACSLASPLPPREYAYQVAVTAPPVTPGSTPAATPATTTQPPITAPAPKDDDSEDLAWIAGPIVGGVVFIVAVIAGIVYCRRRKNDNAGGSAERRVADDSAEVADEHRV